MIQSVGEQSKAQRSAAAAVTHPRPMTAGRRDKMAVPASTESRLARGQGLLEGDSCRLLTGHLEVVWAQDVLLAALRNPRDVPPADIIRKMCSASYWFESK